ncbi:nucleotide sugar dehydrogenase [Roseospirillum parvum]|uniref:UDP-N-acetyl-D-galactosamine dehydrogenase n=1 Tax=Roseospirillum parvum TaxID=83401 RepID=A0A1G8EKT9_9PROT|nr:nucleotide sugar dehydrogenase [Roseospirillum parvum]SDH70319.1 UDP-N-acetyl-D-galactosamine dehydrogenase [Roseospirillum parvum]
MTTPRSVSVIGLGYVGLPVAVAFGRTGAPGIEPVVAFDIDPRRIAELEAGHDRTGEVSDADLAATALTLTTDPLSLKAADFHIVTVPTPIDGARLPDLSPLKAASRTVGAILKPGDIVVYESTVYPGATEDVCVPILEAASGLKLGQDFAVGYSPERINPGDTRHRLATIAKVVSASDPETLQVVADTYRRVIEADIHQAPSIKVAEAAKVIENTQRDLNIALMNELALIFERLGIDTGDVLAAAGTKWNFLPFTPGLVGGHCIGVDPYYLTHRAQQVGYHPEVILAGRRINDGMGAFVARQIITRLLQNGAGPRPRVSVLGLTFKEDVPDIRNTRVVDIIAELTTFGIEVNVADPLADPQQVKDEYNLTLTPLDDLPQADAIVLAVGHHPFREMGWNGITRLLKNHQGIVADVKHTLPRETTPPGVTLWRL